MTRSGCHELTARDSSVPAGRLLRAARTACLLLALALPGLAPGTASAQDGFLLSNLAGTGGGNLGFDVNTRKRARSFTTGPAEHGYSISSAVLDIRAVTTTSAPFEVTIRNDNAGDPADSALAVLTRSSGLVADSDNEFLVQGTLQLQPDTTYWLVAERPDGPVQGSQAGWGGVTIGTGEETDFGWTISFSKDFRYDGTAWNAFGSDSELAFGIRGTEVPPPPPLLSNLENANASAGGVEQRRLAQGFTTGSAANGYDIESVVVAFSRVNMPDIPVSVTIQADNDGQPTGSTVATLTRSDDLVADSGNEFQAPANTRLDPDTTYWILVALTNGENHAARLHWRHTDSSVAVRPGSQAGWSFTHAGRAAMYTNDVFAGLASSRQFKLAITGTEVPGGGPPGGPAVSDPRTRALEYNLASIGRALTATVVNHIRDRAERLEPGGDRTLAMVGGRVLDAGAFAEGTDAGRVSRAIAGIFGGAPAGATELRALLPDARALREQTRLELTAGGASGAAGSTAFWARGDYTAFEGRGGDTFAGFATEGEVVSAHVGFDHRVNPETLVGVAVGQSEGETTHSFAAGGDRHDTETELLSVHPYLHWKPAGGNRVWWGMVGWGTGDATLTEGTDRATTDIALRSWGIGVREVSRLDDLRVAVRADAFRTEIVADAVRSGAIAVGETTGKATRVRAALEGARDWPLDGDATLSGTAELGLRVDSGDGATGKGADIAGKLHYANPHSGLAVTLQGSTLLAHEASGFREWGVGLLVVYDPGESGKGMRLTLNPSWNTPRTGVADALWDAGPGAVGSRASADRGAALGLRLGYGMGALHDRALVAVYGEANGERGGSRVRLGTELRPAGGDRFGFEVYAEREDGAAGPEHLLGLEFGLRF